MGKKKLAVIDAKKKQVIYIIPDFTNNSVMRKLLGLRDKSYVIGLEVCDQQEKNVTAIHCYDILAKKTVFKVDCAAEVNQLSNKDSSVYRFTKSIEISVTEEVIFTVGVYVHGLPGEPLQKGFINAMRIDGSHKEEAIRIIADASHGEKKGLYRISRCTNDDTLIVGSWIDVFVFAYDDGHFEHMHSFLMIHNAFIYNVIAFDHCFFTCSNDCEASLIEF